MQLAVRLPTVQTALWPPTSFNIHVYAGLALVYIYRQEKRHRKTNTDRQEGRRRQQIRGRQIRNSNADIGETCRQRHWGRDWQKKTGRKESETMTEKHIEGRQHSKS